MQSTNYDPSVDGSTGSAGSPIDPSGRYTFKKEVSKEQVTTLLINVTSAEFNTKKEKIYNKLSQTVEIPGFRPGKAPRAMIEARISQNVYGDLINEIIPSVTTEILVSEKLFPLNQVKYEIVKYSDADGLEYKASFINYPEVKLGDLSKISVKKEVKKPDDKEIEKAMQDIVKYYQKTKPAEKKNENASGTDDAKTGTEADVKTEVKTDASAEGSSQAPVEPAEIVLTDELVKSLNINLNSVADLKAQIEKELTMVHARKAEQEWFDKVMKEILEKSKVDVPDSLIQEDVARYEKDYQKKLTDLNLKLDDYLKVQNKTIEELRKEWTEQAAKRFKEELLLLEVIKQQNLTIDPKEVDEEINKIADEKVRSSMQNEEGKRYVSSMLIKQKAIDWIINNIKKD